MPYTGVKVEIPLGDEGLTGSKNLKRIRPGQLLTANNITYENGTLQKEGGATKYNTTAISGSPAVIGGWDWWPTESVQRMIVMTANGASAGKILKDDGTGAFATTMATGLTASGITPVFIEGGSEVAANPPRLFLFSAKNQVLTVSGDGTKANAISKPSTDWSGTSYPFTGCIAAGRLWAFGGTDPHRAYYTTATNHQNFTNATGGAGSIPIYPGEGEGIVGCVGYKSLVVCWKRPFGAYAIDLSDANQHNWSVTKLGNDGMPGPLAFSPVDNDVAFLTAPGSLQLLTAVREYGDVASLTLGEQSEIRTFLAEHVNLTRLWDVRAVFYQAKREIHFAMPATGDTVNSRRLVVDFNRVEDQPTNLLFKFLPRFRWSDRDTCMSLWLRKDTHLIPRPVYGDNAGTIWLMDQADKSKDGDGYAAEFQTPHMDFVEQEPKYAPIRKNGDFLELICEQIGIWGVDVDIFWDGVYAQTINFPMGHSGSALGSFTLGTSALGGNAVLSVRRRIIGSGRRFSMAARNSRASQDFSIAHAYLHFRPSDERG